MRDYIPMKLHKHGCVVDLLCRPVVCMYIENPKYRGCNTKPDEALPCLSVQILVQGSWPESKTGSELGYTIESKVNNALYTPELANEIAFTALFDLP